MSDLTRRQALRHLAAACAAAGAVDALAARDLHAAVRQAAATAPPASRTLTTPQFDTLTRLTDLIIPVEDGRSGAVEAGVPEWIDALLAVNDELKDRYVKGLGWLDAAMTARAGRSFVQATHDQQTALLDVIAFQKNRSAESDAGIDFFILVRRMTVDGFYTSEIGIREVIPEGRPPHAEYVVPRDAIEYVLSRSPFGQAG